MNKKKKMHFEQCIFFFYIFAAINYNLNTNIMKIGIPKEIKDNENRVGMTPSGVAELVKHGHEVFVQQHAGENSGVRRNRDDLRGERRLTEHDGGNGAEPVDEGFAGGRTQGALVEKDEGAGDDERDGDDRRSPRGSAGFARIDTVAAFVSDVGIGQFLRVQRHWRPQRQDRDDAKVADDGLHG